MQPLQQPKKIRFALKYNRKHKLNADGEAVIDIRLTLASKCRFFSSGIFVEPQYWDDKNKRVRETHPLEIQYNAYLQAEVQSMKTFELRMLQRFGKCPLKLFDEYNNEAPAPSFHLSFSQFFQDEIEQRDLTRSSKRNQRTTYSIFTEFRKDVAFDELTYPLIDAFNRHLVRRGLAVNTIHKHHKTLRTYVNRAVLFGYLKAEDNPYRLFKAKTEQTDPVVLSMEELSRLEDLQLPAGQEGLEKTRRLFLLSCYTSLRFGDITRVARRHLEETRHGLQLKIKMEKTQKPIIYPLWLLFRTDGIGWSKPEAIIRQALQEQEQFHRRASLENYPLFRKTNQVTNRDLKELARLAGIKKRLTFHCARRTFCTILATKVDPVTLQRLMVLKNGDHPTLHKAFQQAHTGRAGKNRLELMAREKKIKFTYYLNEGLKPVHDGDEVRFHVYVRISYDRVNTRFPFYVEGHGSVTRDQFEQFFEGKTNDAVNSQIEEFEETLTKIIRFEAKQVGDKYSISGIAKRLYHYHQNMSRELEKHLQQQLHAFSTGQLPGKDLRSTFHDAMKLEDSFLIIEKQIPGFQEKVPSHLVDRLTAYYQFRGFIRTYYKEVRCLDWLDLPTQVAFKEFLFAPHQIQDLFPNEAKHSPFLRLYQQFSLSLEKIPTYLRSMDKMLVEIIC
ncbi:MAG: site-specific integrase [Lewinellaceae bacterium]|nr:site-specific integrase [Lewinellaceae bacterium]